VLFPAGAKVVLQIALRTGLIYLVVRIGVRLRGKREVGQMKPFDLTLLLLLSNSVQNAMTGPDTSRMGAWLRLPPRGGGPTQPAASCWKIH
jgi:uncharacterized membrane protein YcaP (DUF421 family)